MLDDSRIIEIVPDLPQRCQVGPAARAFLDEILTRSEETWEACRARQPFAYPENGFEVRIRPAVEAAFKDDRGRPADSQTIIAASAGDRLLGYIRLSEEARRGGAAHPQVSVEDLWVAPEMRGRGLGRLLLAYVLALGERRGWDNLAASVPEGHERLRALYRSAGFDLQAETFRFGPKRQAGPLPEPAALPFPAVSLLVVPILGICAAVTSLIVVLVTLLA